MNLSGQLNIVVGVNKDRCCADKFVSDQMNRAHRDLLHLLGRCEYRAPAQANQRDAPRESTRYLYA